MHQDIILVLYDYYQPFSSVNFECKINGKCLFITVVKTTQGLRKH